VNGITFFIPLEVATTPAEGHCFVNRWWTVHPQKGVAFYCSKRPYSSFDGFADEEEPSPQCNHSEFAARHIAKRLHPECDVIFLPAVYVRPAIKEMHAQRKLARQVPA